MASVSTSQTITNKSLSFDGTVYLPDNMQSGTTINGSLDFKLVCPNAYYDVTYAYEYKFIVHQYNRNGGWIRDDEVIPYRIIYYGGSGTNTAQWNTGKIFNWGITSGFSTAKSLWSQGNMYSSFPSYSYTNAKDWLNSAGCSYLGYNSYISMEPFLVRYASDNLSGRQNLYKPISISTAMKWSSANPYRGTSVPSGGDRNHAHSPVGFSVYLDQNTSYLSFTVHCQFTNGSVSGDPTWPGDASTNPATHVNTFSHVYRHNGSGFVRDSVAYQFNGSSWQKCRIYKYDGSSWRAIN